MDPNLYRAYLVTNVFYWGLWSGLFSFKYMHNHGYNQQIINVLNTKSHFSSVFDLYLTIPSFNIKVSNDTCWSHWGLGKGSELHPFPNWQAFWLTEGTCAGLVPQLQHPPLPSPTIWLSISRKKEKIVEFEYNMKAKTQFQKACCINLNFILEQNCVLKYNTDYY